MDAAGHVAIESAHRQAGCPAGRGSHGDRGAPATDCGDSPGGCVDVSADVDLVRESAVAPVDLRHAQTLPPPASIAPLSRRIVPTGVAAHLDAWRPPAASGDLARLRDIVLTV
jgi:hypothetical protein